jgi:signal transduction histidine kinase
MAQLRFYIVCILFFLLLVGMGLVASVFFFFWHRGIIGNLDLMQHAVLFRVFQLVGFYVLITAVFLAFIGYFFLSRKLLQPIERLTGQAEEFSGSQDTLLFSSNNGEGFNRLSRALNNLMQQLTQEKEQLRVAVQALEKANAELLAAQQEMIRTEKLVSIGRLSAGLAHEIGNPLSILSGYIELLKSPEITREQAGDFLQRAGKEIERMDILLQRLLEFARPSAGEVQPCSMHRLICECFDDLRYQPLFKGIEFVLELDAPVDQVRADPVQVRQVLLNCAVNAADAIHEKNDQEHGTITVRTRLRDLENESAPQIVIEIQDTGIGIASEDVPTLFDPFFTTKAAGKGTGLGLSVCYMIVQGMGGTVDLRNEPDQGAVVSIALPVLQENQHEN